MGIQDSVKNGILAAGGALLSRSNTPKQYAGKQPEYLEDASLSFYEEYAKYATDFVEAQIQGLRENDPEAWDTVHIRFSDAIQSTPSILREYDDYKLILVAEKWVTYLPMGAKVKALGSTWLVTNPHNLSGSDGAGVVQRCNAVWTTRDYFGNLHHEPICVDKRLAAASDSDYQRIALISKGYFNVKCQYNAKTAQIDTNTRMILGSGAYRVTGYSDFTREFTKEKHSVRLLEFSIRTDEINEAIDDLQNEVAGGLNFEWKISISGTPTLAVGQTGKVTASSLRCGKKDEYGHYLFESSDDDIATVDAAGNVAAISDGSCLITARLAENHDIFSDFAVNVTSAAAIAFTETPPQKISAYETAVLSVQIIQNGQIVADTVEWVVGGAEEGSYTAAIDENTLTIQCWRGSVTPLTVTASYGGSRIGVSIELEGI